MVLYYYMPKLSTQKMYMSKIKSLRDKYSIEDLGDYDNVVNKINNLNDCKDYILATLWFDLCVTRNIISGNVQKINDIVLDKYRNKLKSINDNLEQTIKSSRMTKKQKENYCEWKELITIRNKLIEEQNFSFGTLIYSLYTIVPPRRVKDYVFMYYIDSNNHNLFNESKEKNYCVDTEKKMYFIFNVHKTEDTVKIKKYDIPDRLRNVIMGYIKKENIKNEQKMINLKNESYVCKKIHEVMKTYTNKNIGVQMLRHIFSSWIEVHSTRISQMEREKLSCLMGHTHMQNISYSKHLDIDEDKIRDNIYFKKEIEDMINMYTYD